VAREGDMGEPTGQPPRSPWRLVIGVTLAVGLIVGVVTVIIARRDNAPQTQEVVLEAVGDTGTDPFTDSIATHEVALQTSVTPTEDSGNGIAVSGGQPGLYGGTQDNATCDALSLVKFLEANPDKATAWAAVFDIQPADIRDYVGRLTPLLLRTDTRVTNHGYRDGIATPLQSVLQAGTAVLVDTYGIPRVRCSCGNPLTEPAPISTSLDSGRITLVGQRWDYWNPATVIIINATTQITSFTVYDIDTNTTFTQAPGVDVSESSTDSERYGHSGEPISEESLRNGTLPTDVCESVGAENADRRLVDGQVPGIPAGYGAIFVDETAVGDLDGDGVADGVVVYGCSPGGTAVGSWTEVVVYLASAPTIPITVDAPSAVDEANEGGLDGSFSPSIDTLAIRDQRLTATWNVWGRNDPRGDPSRRVTTTWTVDASGPTLVDSQRTR
jgi:hypothetical protein